MNKIVIVGGIVLLSVVVTLGAVANSKQPSFPPDGQQALDDFVRRFEDSGFNYAIVSTHKATASQFDADSVDKIETFSGYGGEQRPAGVCPGGTLVKETWCVVVDKEVETSSGERFTHFVVQKQNQVWFADGVPASGAELFQSFGCRNW